MTTVSSDGSVTRWIRKAKAGEEDAVQRLWERYFPQLVTLCQKRLRGHPRRVADEEDVALSVFDSFCQRAARGRFPQLQDRDDLWRLLVVIAARKAINLVHHDHGQRRGGQRVVGESDLPIAGNGADVPGLEQIIGREPTPDFAALVAEEYERLLAKLDDESHRKVAIWKLEGYSNEEIALQSDCSLRTVERKLALIRKRLAGENAGS
jgi:DNA-directed RNA polymerase specialized sigma24 family protein